MLMAEEQVNNRAAGPAADLMARLEPIIPAIRSRTEVADRIRDTPAETISELSAADLFRVFQPRRWGGLECDPRTFFALQNRIAEVCPSTAWVYGVLCVQSLVLALFNDQAQADVWGEDSRSLVCSSFAPVGTAEPVDGGYRISGRWSFSSGSSHASWALVGAKRPQTAPPSGPPALNLFLIPREDFRIEDVWHTFGLRGTGSNDLIAADIFVPDHRTVTLDPGIQNVRAAERPGSPLYRLPWLYLFTSSISNFAAGAARGALNGFLEVSRKRASPLSGKVARDDPATLQAAARLAADIDTVEAMYARHLELLLRQVSIDEPIPMAEALLMRTQLTSALRTLAASVDDLMLLQGAGAIHLASPVTRAWLDLSAARAHIGNDPAIATTMLGTALIGKS